MIMTTRLVFDMLFLRLFFSVVVVLSTTTTTTTTTASLLHHSNSGVRDAIDPECNECILDGRPVHIYDAECRVYGMDKTRNSLIAWHLAPPSCLEHFSIHIETVPVEQVHLLWPDGPYQAVQTKELIKYLQDLVHYQTSHELLTDAIVAALKGFFVNAANDQFQLRDRVTVGATVYNCLDNRDGENCWTALDLFLSSTNDGRIAAEVLGKHLTRLVSHDLEEEQRSVRMALCQHDDEPAHQMCGALATQVLEQVEGNPTLDCSILGLGPEHLKMEHCVLEDQQTAQSASQMSGARGEFMSSSSFVLVLMTIVGMVGPWLL